MNRLLDKVAIITGGAGCIGVAAARLFAEEGAKVLLVDVDPEALEHAMSEIDLQSVRSCVADISTLEGNNHMVAKAVELYDGVDILIANAGVEGQVRGISDYDVDVFDHVMSVNVRGPWLGLKAVLPEMEKRGGGSVVITSSVAGLRGTPGIAPYATSKHAVVGLMRSAAKECSDLNIRVNTVHPSPVESEMMRRLEIGLSPGSPEAASSIAKAAIPMGRYAQPIEVVRVILFLASDESSWVTGSVYAVDGGYTA